MNTSNQIKDSLDDFIQKELLDEPFAGLADEADLLTTNLIDSLGWMRVVEFIESAHGFRVPPEDITIENFINLDTLSAYVSKNV